MLAYYFNDFNLIFFSIQVPDYKNSGDRFGQDSNETNLDSYSTVFDDSDEFRIFSEIIQRK